MQTGDKSCEDCSVARNGEVHDPGAILQVLVRALAHLGSQIVPEQLVAPSYLSRSLRPLMLRDSLFLAFSCINGPSHSNHLAPTFKLRRH